MVAFSLDDIREAIEDLQAKIEEATGRMDAAELVGQDHCEKDNSDASLDCDGDCLDCAQDIRDTAEGERDQFEAELAELEAFIEATAHQFEPLVDHVLVEKNGHFGETLRFFAVNDFTVYSSLEEYVEMWLDNVQCDESLRLYIDTDRLGGDLLAGESYLELGDNLVVFY